MKLQTTVTQKSLITGATTTRKPIKLPILNPAKIISKQTQQIQIVQPGPPSPGQPTAILLPKGKLHNVQLQNRGQLQTIAAQGQVQTVVASTRSQVQVPSSTPLSSSQGQVQLNCPPLSSAQQRPPGQIPSNIYQLPVGSQVLVQQNSLPVQTPGAVQATSQVALQQGQGAGQTSSQVTLQGQDTPLQVPQAVSIQSFTQSLIGNVREPDTSMLDKQTIQTIMGQVRPQLQVQFQNNATSPVMVRPQIRIQNTVPISSVQATQVQIPIDGQMPNHIPINTQDISTTTTGNLNQQTPAVQVQPVMSTSDQPIPPVLEKSSEHDLQLMSVNSPVVTVSSDVSVSQLLSGDSVSKSKSELSEKSFTEVDEALFQNTDQNKDSFTNVTKEAHLKLADEDLSQEVKTSSNVLMDEVKDILSEEIISLQESLMSSIKPENVEKEMKTEIQPKLETSMIVETDDKCIVEEKMEKEENTVNEKKSEVKQEECIDGSGSGAAQDFDPADIMEWEDGIGTLPGSDLKVQKHVLFWGLHMSNFALFWCSINFFKGKKDQKSKLFSF